MHFHAVAPLDFLGDCKFWRTVGVLAVGDNPSVIEWTARRTAGNVVESDLFETSAWRSYNRPNGDYDTYN